MSQPTDIEVLFVSHKSPPATGGMEKQNHELIQGTAHYLKVHSIVYDHKELLLIFFIQLNRRIINCLNTNPKIKVIHFNDGLIAALATFHTGYQHIKKTMTIHGLDIVFPLAYFQRKIIPRFNSFDRIFAVSEATAAAAITRGICSQKIEVIPNGVDSPPPHTSDYTIENLYLKYPLLQKGKKYFITIGRPVKRKGFSWLAKHVIPQLHGDFQLVMVGPYSSRKTAKDHILSILPSKLKNLITLFLGYPSDQEELRKILPRNSTKVVHLGKLPNQDLQLLLKSASAFLMPNIPVRGDMEGFGLVCLEASVAGTLVIASAIEGITSAVQHQKNGILLPTQNPDAWVRTLQNIIKNPEPYRTKAKKFTEHTLAHYSWDKMAKGHAIAFLEISC